MSYKALLEVKLTWGHVTGWSGPLLVQKEGMGRQAAQALSTWLSNNYQEATNYLKVAL